MSSLMHSVWGRQFDIEIIFEDWDDEGPLETQQAAYERLLEQWQTVEDALPKLKEYCLGLDADKIGETKIDNIFRYVIPKSLFICRDQAHDVVALLCDYRFDPDNGIAMVFADGNLTEMGTQDIVL